MYELLGWNFFRGTAVKQRAPTEGGRFSSLRSSGRVLNRRRTPPKKMESGNKATRRSALSIEQRFQIVQQLKSGVSISTLAAKYDIHPMTIRRIRQNAGIVCQLVKQGAEMRSRKNLRKPANEELDSRLYAWFLEQKTLGALITDVLLLEKATELNREYAGPSSFKASRGWLWKFKNRHGIRLSHIFNEREDTQQFLDDFARRIKKERINYENVYSMDETDLVWKTLPTETATRILKMDKVSVGLCANVTGSHKLAPLFIHKMEDPRELKHPKDRLPVIFRSQPEARMDQEIFADWYQNHFKPSVRRRQTEAGVSGKVLLLLEKCRRYNLEAPEECRQGDQYEIVFLYPTTSSLLQPMDQWVSEKTKTSYRYKMLRRIMSLPGGVREFYFEYDLKDCMDLLCEAWSEISVSYIRYGWGKIIKQIPDHTPIKEEPDPLELSLQDIIGVITGEPASEESVNEFLSNCADAENNVYGVEVELQEKKEIEDTSNDIKKSPSSTSSSSSSSSSSSYTPIDAEEMRKIFKTLTRWSKRKPNSVRSRVKYLKAYYERK